MKTAFTFKQLLKSRLEKFNPYHDRLGRFSTADGASSFTYKPGQGKMYDNAIAREKERMAALDDAKQQANGFTPAKTELEAVTYAMNELGFTAVHYGDMDIDTINHVNSEIKAVYDKYPDLQGAVSTFTSANGSFIGRAGVSRSGYIGLELNNKDYSKGLDSVKADRQTMVDAGWTVPVADPKANIWHEYGHIYAYVQCKKQMGVSSTDRFGYYDGQDYLKSVKSKGFEKQVIRDAAKSLKITQKELKSRISRYAETKPGETWAEAFSEYHCSDNPRPECVAMMKAAGLAQ